MTKNRTTGGTENYEAVDDHIKHSRNSQNAYEEGFAASSGIRNETAESDGRVKHPERGDESRPDPVSDSIQTENPGLADN